MHATHFTNSHSAILPLDFLDQMKLLCSQTCCVARTRPTAARSVGHLKCPILNSRRLFHRVPFCIWCNPRFIISYLANMIPWLRYRPAAIRFYWRGWFHVLFQQWPLFWSLSLLCWLWFKHEPIFGWEDRPTSLILWIGKTEMFRLTFLRLARQTWTSTGKALLPNWV